MLLPCCAFIQVTLLLFDPIWMSPLCVFFIIFSLWSSLLFSIQQESTWKALGIEEANPSDYSFSCACVVKLPQLWCFNDFIHPKVNFLDTFVNSVCTHSFGTLAAALLDLILEKYPYLVTILASIVMLRRLCFLGLLCNIICISSQVLQGHYYHYYYYYLM